MIELNSDPQQRMDALAKANRVRTERRKIREGIASGEVLLSDVLRDPPPWMLTLRVVEALQFQPRVGNGRARETLRRLCHHVDMAVTVGHLAQERRLMLAEVVARRERARDLTNAA